MDSDHLLKDMSVSIISDTLGTNSSLMFEGSKILNICEDFILSTSEGIDPFQ